MSGHLAVPPAAAWCGSVSKQDLFNRAVAALHDAALDDAGLPHASAWLDAACGNRGSVFAVGNGHASGNGQVHWVQFWYGGRRWLDGERRYFDTYYRQDARNRRLATMPAGRLVPMERLYTPQERRHSPAYNEALPRGQCRHGLNVRMQGPGGTCIVWILADSVHRDGWSSTQIRLVEGLLPHVRQFVRVRQSLLAADALGTSFAGLLEHSWVGLIQLDRYGRIVEANDRAADMLRQGEGLRNDSGYLQASLPEDNSRLHKLLARALPAAGGQRAGGSIAVRRPARRPGLAVHVHPVGGRHIAVGAPGVAAVVLIADSASRPHIDPRLVASALGLTTAETDVAVALATGDSVRDIASATGRQENSVRFLLKRIYRKHGISRQAEVVRMVLTLAAAAKP